MYILNYVDRNVVPHARMQGLEEDLGPVGYEYNIFACKVGNIAYLISNPALTIL